MASTGINLFYMRKLLAQLLFIIGATLCISIQSLAQNLPDLAVASVSWTGQPVAGQGLTLNMVVTNIGSGAASGSWQDEWVLSTNTTVGGQVAGGVFTENCNFGQCNHTVSSNGSYSVSLGFTLPNVPAGAYYLIGVVDDGDSLYESNYANNTS